MFIFAVHLWGMNNSGVKMLFIGDTHQSERIHVNQRDASFNNVGFLVMDYRKQHTPDLESCRIL